MARFSRRLLLLVLLLVFLGFDLCSGQQSPATHHSCSHGHDHHHHHGGNHHHDHREERRKLLPEEIAEEEDLKLGRLHPFELHHSAASSDLSGLGIWIHAMGCSLLVSMASLVCLTIIPILCAHGNPSKAVVDTLALFGAGAMLGDAFLHQLPHAFGGEHSHMHEEHFSHADDHVHSEPSHSHSVKDLSVGLSVLTGIVLFLVVEKIVRFVEEKSNGGHWGHGHHHGKSSKKQKDDDDVRGKMQQQSSETELSDGAADFRSKGEQDQLKSVPKKRNRNASVRDDKSDIDASSGDLNAVKPAMPPSNRVFGYLNLFSDGVHNFTDGMALGSAFLLYGSVGGWSRTLFLLAHELPQEVGDFGILVRSGFSVSKALFFNFLSALVALAGTALALLLGQDPGHSSLIEGFTAGGFIYIAVAGVLAEMNSSGNSSLKATVSQLTSLVSGMGVALYISLIE